MVAPERSSRLIWWVNSKLDVIDMTGIIPFLMFIPFGILLLSIAIMPLSLPHFWEKNRNKAVIAGLISLPVLIYLLLNSPQSLIHTLEEYISFILLLASLFIISGGILITGDIKATPRNNTIFLLLGAIIANFIGTTGASMILIRPLLTTISERKHINHIPVFFIFIVSNIGGSLTPLGDPPLFLGYLRGVPFTWTLKLFPIWLFTITLLLLTFYIWDSICFQKESKRDILKDQTIIKPIRITGLINIVLLLTIIVAVFFQTPSPYRELIMIGMTIGSLFLTKKELRAQNNFTFAPIIEVAVLFAGIFITMVPLLTFLETKGATLGITKPWQFFWLSGGLSSFLDNAPTYLTFTSLAKSVTQAIHPAGIPIVPGILVRADLLRAISCGAVFMGANTYIGNGPNFMVKSIAEEQGIKVPHFFGYMVYSGFILLPIFVLVTLLFFR
jgi:Na+/H+ antiporter NhaD/arsenite permease-like protein